VGYIKTVLRGKFIAINAYFKNIKMSQTNDLMLHLKVLGKQEKTKPKTNRRREIIKIRAKISEIEATPQKSHTYEQLMKQEVGSLK
jgi:hypothetical protein